jgi:predicted lipid-binding transport protein (Tim44 family)
MATGNTNMLGSRHSSHWEDFMLRLRPLFAVCAVAAALALMVSDADARAGRGGSFGSRGSQTFSAPPSTATSPGAGPVERSMTQPNQPGLGQRAPTTSPLGGFFGRPGFLGGLFTGFLGAGLLGMLFGHGLFGGLGGFASVLGLVLQIALLAFVARMIWAWWQRRTQPALAGGPAFRDHASGANGSALGSALGLGGGGSRASAQRASGTDEIGLTPDDFNTFERVLGEVQTDYSAEDLGRLRTIATPEVVSYFSEDLAANASKGVVNRVSEVKLLQGNLAEAWREGDTEYATVAMRYSLNDQMVDRQSGRLVEGGPDEATEVWTFMRRRGGHWLLSAIQQS